MRDHLLGRIHEQYQARRVAVEEALESREALERRQQRLRESLDRMVGELSEKTPLKAQVTGVIKADGYKGLGH